MYAPRPQTHQISRHYTAFTDASSSTTFTHNHLQTHQTARKAQHGNKEKENAMGLPSKTPSRLGAKSLGVSLGAKTVGRDRNVLGQGGRIGPGAGEDEGGGKGKGKGKGKEGDEIEPKRLFASTSGPGGSSSSSLLPTSKSFSSFPPITTTTRHQLQSKTPNPKQRTKTPGNTLRTPAPNRAFTLQPQQHIPEEPAAAPLPSASKPRRSRSSLTLSNSLSNSHSNSNLGSLTPAKVGVTAGIVRPQVTQQVFKTPAPRVRHNHGGNDEDGERGGEGEGEGEGEGDGDRSLDDIAQGMNELDLSINGALEEVVELEEETLEMQLEEEGWAVEYMPPRSIPLPDELPFPVPDISEPIAAISALPALWTPTFDDESLFSREQEMQVGMAVMREIRREMELEGMSRGVYEQDDDLEEPMFRKKPPTALAKLKVKADVAQSATRTGVLKSKITNTNANSGAVTKTNSNPTKSLHTAAKSVAFANKPLASASSTIKTKATFTPTTASARKPAMTSSATAALRSTSSSSLRAASGQQPRAVPSSSRLANTNRSTSSGLTGVTRARTATTQPGPKKTVPRTAYLSKPPRAGSAIPPKITGITSGSRSAMTATAAARAGNSSISSRGGQSNPGFRATKTLSSVRSSGTNNKAAVSAVAQGEELEGNDGEDRDEDEDDDPDTLGDLGLDLATGSGLGAGAGAVQSLKDEYGLDLDLDLDLTLDLDFDLGVGTRDETNDPHSEVGSAAINEYGEDTENVKSSPNDGGQSPSRSVTLPTSTSTTTIQELAEATM